QGRNDGLVVVDQLIVKRARLERQRGGAAAGEGQNAAAAVEGNPRAGREQGNGVADRGRQRRRVVAAGGGRAGSGHGDRGGLPRHQAAAKRNGVGRAVVARTLFGDGRGLRRGAVIGGDIGGHR